MQQAAPRQYLIGAVGWMMGAVVSLLAMAVAGRELAAEISVFEIMFFRNSICLTIICLVMLYYGRRLLVTRRLGLHLIRNICHFFAQAGFVRGQIVQRLGRDRVGANDRSYRGRLLAGHGTPG